VNGAIPHSADGPPMLGPVAGLRNFWLCCGSSFGIAQSAGCGKYLAQWMLHGESELNMTGLDPRRFGVFADQDFMRAKGFQDYSMTYFTPQPGEELPAARDCRTSPLHERLKTMGCVNTQTFGWERPKWFSVDGREEEYSYRRNNIFETIGDECRAVRERVGLLDLSGFAKYEVSGPDSEQFLNRICANRMPAKDGGIVLAHVLSESGRIRAEMTVTRLNEDRFYLLSAAAAELRDMDHLLQALEPQERVVIQNISEEYGVLVVAGPESRRLLQPLTPTNLDSEQFPWLSGREITVADIKLTALRVNYVGELGWELHVPMQSLAELYEALWTAGQPLAVANFGLYAVNSLRMEKAYRGWGAELTNEVTMLDAAMERFIKFDKVDFTGREATLSQRDTGLAMRLIYFEIEVSDSDVRGGEPVFSGENCVGVTTSGAYGHMVKKSLGFAYVDPAHARAGTRLQIDLLGGSCLATVLDEAAYDPSNSRLRA